MNNSSSSMKILVTGSSGLIGSQVSEYFCEKNHQVHGIDNNQREVFFGPEGSTRWRQRQMVAAFNNFTHHELDIRDRLGVIECLQNIEPDVVVHCAAQPSHDKAAAIPFDDFDTNAVGTLNLLEAARMVCINSPFIHMSTNKVYGDAPNRIKLKELDKRWEYDDPKYMNGIAEDFTVDQSMHSLFGAAKVAGDIMVQEYGRYFNMKTCCLRGGCLTGPDHSGVELHGFLSFLIKCNLEGRLYRVYGYKGKQVRDNIHSLDVVRFIDQFIHSPRVAEVYNIGGGKENSCSILEMFDLIERYTGNKMVYEYVEQNRIGDHICYYSDLRKIKSHFPDWNITISLEQIIEQIVEGWKNRKKN